MIRMIMMAKTERRISLCGWFLVFGFIAAVGAESFDMSDKEPECLEGWIPIHRGCFKFVEAGAKWEDARDSCRSEKGDLTYVQSLKEKSLLEEHLRTHYPTFSTWWVGLHRQENKGTDWKWLDEGVVDSAVMPWRFPRMAERPGNVCGVLEMLGGSIYAANEMCSRKKPYICEFNSIMPRPTTKATTNDPTSTTITTPGTAKQGGSLNTTEDIYSKVTTSDQKSQDTEPKSFDMSDKEPECLEGWIPIHRGCFKFVEAGANWEDARDSCRSEKGDLTYIQSLKEKNLLEEHLRTHFPTFATWWMGLHRQEYRGTDWKWLDEGVVDSNVIPWRIPRMAGRPGRVCGVLEIFGGRIYAANDICVRTKPYICEYNSIMPRPTTKATTIYPTSTTITTPGPAKQGGSLNTTEDINSNVMTTDQKSQDTEPSTAPPEEVETETSPQQPDEVRTSTTEHMATTSQVVSGDPQEDGGEKGQGAERNGQGSGSPKTTIIDFYVVFLSLCYFFCRH